ncbi:hypothetical protein ACFFX0_25590 [Citricoccus parietis]|uniref:Uncharacterized protein n=1 Tax=Citricoccus parietis TaxID=592307 RepID=A0ABV5G7I0_9MICC
MKPGRWTALDGWPNSPGFSRNSRVQQPRHLVSFACLVRWCLDELGTTELLRQATGARGWGMRVTARRR